MKIASCNNIQSVIAIPASIQEMGQSLSNRVQKTVLPIIESFGNAVSCVYSFSARQYAAGASLVERIVSYFLSFFSKKTETADSELISSDKPAEAPANTTVSSLDSAENLDKPVEAPANTTVSPFESIENLGKLIEAPANTTVSSKDVEEKAELGIALPSEIVEVLEKVKAMAIDAKTFIDEESANILKIAAHKANMFENILAEGAEAAMEEADQAAQDC